MGDSLKPKYRKTHWDKTGIREKEYTPLSLKMAQGETIAEIAAFGYDDK